MKKRLGSEMDPPLQHGQTNQHTDFQLACTEDESSQWVDIGCEDGQASGIGVSGAVDSGASGTSIQFVVREQGTENAMTSDEISTVKRYYKMNRAQLTLRLNLQRKGEFKRNIFVLAMFEDKIVGFCQVVWYGRDWYIWNLMRRRYYSQASSMRERVIKKLSKGRFGGTPVNLRGVGAQLLEHAENLVRDEVEPGTKLKLDIKSKYSHVLRPYYEKHGYTCRDCDAWWHMNVYHFEKEL